MPVNLIGNPAASPASLAKAMLQAFGRDWLMWEPTTLWEEIQTELLGGSELDRANKDKIMAARVVILSDSPWQDWESFINIALAFNDIPISPEAISICTPAQLAWAVYQMNILGQPDDQFSRETQDIMASMLIHEGILWLPAFSYEKMPEYNGEQSLRSILGDELSALSFRINPDSLDLVPELDSAWDAHTEGASLEEVQPPITETAMIHTFKLMAMERYVLDHIEADATLDAMSDESSGGD